MLFTHLLAVAELEGWKQFGELILAGLLSAAIGVERSLTRKSAGLRTYSLVGVGAALWVLISKYGFGDVLSPGLVIVDPSRVAAQIVTGVSFLGAGLIFVKRDGVRGLTTAAGIWVTAAIGAAAGAGLVLLAMATTIIYFIIIGARLILVRFVGVTPDESLIAVTYPKDTDALSRVLRSIPDNGFALVDLLIHPGSDSARDRADLTLSCPTGKSVAVLIADLAGISGVHVASVSEPSPDSD